MTGSSGVLGFVAQKLGKGGAVDENLKPLAEALNAESWDWLVQNQPELAKAVQTVVEGGVDPDKVFLFVNLHTGRPDIAARCKQAAQHIKAQSE